MGLSVTELRVELDRLDEKQLAYVIARSKCVSDAKAIEDSGVSRSTVYRAWDEATRAKLNELAQRFKRETAAQVLMVMQENAITAAEAIAGLIKSRNENVKLKASQDILDRVVGRASQPVELTGKDGGAIEVDDARESIQRKLAGISTASDEG